MGILVHKYGGTSVGTTEKIKRIAKRVIAEKEKGNDMVVVVSAMGENDGLFSGDVKRDCYKSQ